MEIFDLKSMASRTLGGAAGAGIIDLIKGIFDSTDKKLEQIILALNEIDRTIIDGFTGVDVILGRLSRERERVERFVGSGRSLDKILDIIPGSDFEFLTEPLEALQEELDKLLAETEDLPGPVRDFVSAMKEKTQDVLESIKKHSFKGSTESAVQFGETKLKDVDSRIEERTAEIESSLAALGRLDPEVLNELNTLLKDLTTAIGGEEGLLAAFLELDNALQGANLPAGLEALAQAVETAVARIANAVNAPSGGAKNGMASGGTVAPGQPVLVGERGPEIFVPSTAGSIVNAFDASADPSAIGAAGSSGQIVQALESLEDTISELDETIQEAESAGLNGVGGSGRPSSSRRGFRSRGSGTSALDEVENFLATVESTSEAFENIERTMSNFRNQAENDFEGISEAGQQAFQSILGSIQSLVSNFIGGKAGRVVGTIAGFARIFGFGLAGGGDLQPGLPVLVGERGPEVIVPSTAGTIVDAFGARKCGQRSLAA